jgi:hypothetical protein
MTRNENKKSLIAIYSSRSWYFPSKNVAGLKEPMPLDRKETMIVALDDIASLRQKPPLYRKETMMVPSNDIAALLQIKPPHHILRACALWSSMSCIVN